VARFSVIVLVLLLFLTSGCGLFSTRNPEAPDTGRRTWETPRVPDDVLTNMRSALFERDAVNYLRSFNPDAFQFIADQVTVARDPSVANWDYDMESQHVAKLFSSGTLPADSILIVTFTSPVETILGDSAEVRVQYDLQAGVALTGVPHHVAGTADFFFRIGTEGYWQINRWQDTRTEEGSTWSDFKSLVR
jgi:hypothetical protein